MFKVINRLILSKVLIQMSDLLCCVNNLVKSIKNLDYFIVSFWLSMSSKTFILFSIVVVPTYIPTNSAQGFPFLHQNLSFHIFKWIFISFYFNFACFSKKSLCQEKWSLCRSYHYNYFYYCTFSEDMGRLLFFLTVNILGWGVDYSWFTMLCQF